MGEWVGSLRRVDMFALKTLIGAADVSVSVKWKSAHIGEGNN